MSAERAVLENGANRADGAALENEAKRVEGAALENRAKREDGAAPVLQAASVGGAAFAERSAHAEKENGLLAGKVALVTGASRGIGAQIAKSFASEGASVIVGCNGSVDRAHAVAEEIRSGGGAADIWQCDVSDFAACGEMIQNIWKKYGRIDILVNNAGITRDGLLARMSEEDFDRVIGTNLKGAFNAIRHSTRYFLKQRSGKIINLSSVSGILGNAGQANYSASKAGVIGLTKSAARELASRGICVNAIAPGLVATDMTEAMTAEAREKLTASIPLRRIGTPEDVANLAVFLASGKSDYITGQVFAVDGGMSI